MERHALARALPRASGGKKIPARKNEWNQENLPRRRFPYDQPACCLENIAGDRVVLNHPLVKQTIDDCLTEAMDIEGLENLPRLIRNRKK